MERGTFVAAPYRSYSTESRQGGQITGFEETDGMAAFTKSQLHPTRLGATVGQIQLGEIGVFRQLDHGIAAAQLMNIREPATRLPNRRTGLGSKELARLSQD
jgi:hypothetical protein